MTDREAVSRELSEELGWTIDQYGDWRVINRAEEMLTLPRPTRDKLISLRGENERLKQELADLREDTNPASIERGRNADKFGREGY